VNRDFLTPVAPRVRSGRDPCATLRANISAYDAADGAAAEILGSSLSRPFRADAGWPVPRLDRPFDRMLTIDKHTWQVAAEDGRFDSAAGAVASKIKRSWQEHGEFPPGVVFSS